MIVVCCFFACLCGYLVALNRLKFLNLKVGARKSTPISNDKISFNLSKLHFFTSRRPVSQGEEKRQDVICANLEPNPMAVRKRRVIVAMTGATGAILGIRLLEKLRQIGVETHLVISKWAGATIVYETDYKLREVRALATKTYSAHDVAAPISSGSFKIDAMIIAPCSMKTLSSIATGYGDDLISRAADVTFKERRRLIVVARETPLSGIHLENMTKVTQNGGIIFPPVPAFYIKPKNIDDIVDQSVGRMLDLIDMDTGDFERWSGVHKFDAQNEEL